MANTIELAKIYTKITDDIYKQACLTSDLDGDMSFVKEGYNAHEIVIPKISMSGLADYSRNGGYVDGDVTVDWETVACDFDRGRRFSVDELDNVETGGVAFGKLAGEFIRTKVVPEVDAYRLAKYASVEGIGSASAVLSSGADVIAALRACANNMDENEVPTEGRLLYITPTLLGLAEDIDTTKSKAVLNRFSKIIPVPQSRFYTAIKQKDGTTDGETDGGYAKAADGKNINFMSVHPSAVIQFPKHVKPKIINPDANPNSDAWLYGYRLVAMARAFENKVKGIYCHKSTT